MLANSQASWCESGGNRAGIRDAIIDLPSPGAPIIKRLCPPATAMRAARLARSWPLISDHSKCGVMFIAVVLFKVLIVSNSLAPAKKSVTSRKDYANPNCDDAVNDASSRLE